MRSFLYLIMILATCACNTKGSGYAFDDRVNVRGRYVVKETCAAEPANNYALIALEVPQRYGDTIVFDGSTYGNVVRTRDLHTEFEHVGKLFDFDARIAKSSTSFPNCTAMPAITFT